MDNTSSLVNSLGFVASEIFNLPVGASQSSESTKRRLEQKSFVPLKPSTLQETRLSDSLLESLILKTLHNLGVASGRRIADQMKLPFGIVNEMLHALKMQLLVAHKASAAMSDYEYELSQAGFERARRFTEQCTYFGAAPVALEDYLASIEKQSIRNIRPRMPHLRMAFEDLLLPVDMLSQVGQAVNAGRGLFLYGPPGNGKSSIAERVMRCASEAIWIPRTISVGREIIRLYDPATHEAMPLEDEGMLLSSSQIDGRWIRIRRPTVVVGGELTLEQLEISYNSQSGVNEAPLQLKSNCGALVVDDLGRQRVSVMELLNRWIIPLEKGIDFLALASGRQIRIPFDQLIVFATNLEPKELVDEAFLRRIPYKIEVVDPTVEQFHDLFKQNAPSFGFEASESVLEHLVLTHFAAKKRPLRFCFVRDILEQAKNYCEFHEQPMELSEEIIDIATKNYFAGL